MSIRELVQLVHGLPREDYRLIVDFLDHNELGLALETLCVVIEQEGLAIDCVTFGMIRKIGEDMGLDPDYWVNITVSKTAE